MKPDNILCGGSHVDIKLADFGFANVLGTRTGFKSSVGTPVFMAPEIGDAMGSGGYSCAVDVWSAVSIPTMLVGLARIANLVARVHTMSARQGNIAVVHAHWRSPVRPKFTSRNDGTAKGSAN